MYYIPPKVSSNSGSSQLLSENSKIEREKPKGVVGHGSALQYEVSDPT